MEEQEEESNVREESHQFVDSFTNRLEIGNIKIQSPHLKVSELKDIALEILKDKEARSYLESLKGRRVSNQEMF